MTIKITITDGKENSYIPQISFPLLLTSSIRMVNLSQLMKQYRCILIKVHIMFRFLYFLDLMLIFCSRIPSKITYFKLSRLLRPLLAVIVRFSLFLMTFTVLRSTGQVFCKISLSGSLSHVLLMIRPRLCIFGRKTTEVNCHFNHILAKVHAINITDTVDVDFDHWLR